jgi:uncharacterized protein with PIN domain
MANEIDFSRLEAAVSQDETVNGSAATLLAQLSQMIRDAAAQGTDAVNALADRLDAQQAALAAAVEANTPASEEPPPSARRK